VAGQEYVAGKGDRTPFPGERAISNSGCSHLGGGRGTEGKFDQDLSVPERFYIRGGFQREKGTSQGD